MNRRGFLRAVGATGLMLVTQGPVVRAAFWSGKNPDAKIRQALAERRVVEFDYHGYPRRVEPHALGQVGEGRAALLGWQVAGGSASEPPPGWRTFVLGEISGLRLTRVNFSRRPDYDAARSSLKRIVAEAPGTTRD